MATITWEPPGPGPWQQDSAHNPVSQTALMQEIYPPGFNRGFTEAFAGYGLLLDRLAMGVVNGFTYHQPQPFDMPGPDGPKDPEWIGAEIGRRTEVAAQAMADQIWRDELRTWDAEVKPAAQARHRELGSVDLGALGDADLLGQLQTCLAHVTAMVYQHHRYNCHALVPVGDFVLQTAGWTHRPPMSLYGVLDGFSPVSNVSSPEIQDAVAALRADQHALDLLHSGGDPAAVLAELRSRVPAVDDYVANVHFRLIEGFDVVNPTTGERPDVITGRLAAAVAMTGNPSIERADALAASLRAEVPAECQADFDDLLTEARLVYRLRDERGIYSEIAAVGLLRLTLLEIGRRLVADGKLTDAEHVFELRSDELEAILGGSAGPSPDELQQRREGRLRLTLDGPPRFLGPPPPPPPPLEMLPPPMARVMAAVGFSIDGILGQLDEPAGTATSIVGIAGAGGVYEGTARLVRSIDDLMTLESGDVLVAPTTGEAFNSMLHLVGAIVTDHGSFASHAAIVSREMGIPSVVGTVNGTARIHDGARVRVDGTAGTVDIL
jgi:phosphohistidine swiveling domain-containing protein